VTEGVGQRERGLLDCRPLPESDLRQVQTILGPQRPLLSFSPSLPSFPPFLANAPDPFSTSLPHHALCFLVGRTYSVPSVYRKTKIGMLRSLPPPTLWISNVFAPPFSSANRGSYFTTACWCEDFLRLFPLCRPLPPLASGVLNKARVSNRIPGFFPCEPLGLRPSKRSPCFALFPPSAATLTSAVPFCSYLSLWAGPPKERNRLGTFENSESFSNCAFSPFRRCFPLR